MSHANAIGCAAVSLTALGMIWGAVYAAVRMGIRDAVLALELRIGDKYVTSIACGDHRESCDKLRASKAK